jgi:peptidoglycan lytic transglycosylase
MGEIMTGIACDASSCIEIARTAVRLLAVALTAATLAACAQPVVTEKPASLAADRAASPEPARKSSSVRNTRVASVASKPAADPQEASHGLASYYSDSRTASGEKFDGKELTAAHRTLPFGTRVRVTNVKTGRSVTVRINDRGPFVPGRVVDVSHAAAKELGMVSSGLAKVKVDVVQ